MAQWYAHLVLRGDELLGEGLDDFASVEGVREGLEGEPYATVIVSGYALYGKLRGYYSLGVSRILVDPSSGDAYYASEKSSLHKEPVESLTDAQKGAIRNWLMDFDAAAWENSTEPFKLSLASDVAIAQ